MDKDLEILSWLVLFYNKVWMKVSRVGGLVMSIARVQADAGDIIIAITRRYLKKLVLFWREGGEFESLLKLLHMY